MRKIFVSDIAELISPSSQIVIRLAPPKKDVFYSGELRDMPETWHNREVTWMLPTAGGSGFILDID